MKFEFQVLSISINKLKMDIKNSIIEKTFNQYKIKITSYTNSITILINDTYFNNKYQNNFNINYLQ